MPHKANHEDKTGKDSIDKEVWAQARHSAANQTGGFAGVGPEGQQAQIQKHYDQLVENDKNLKKWAGDTGILGDV